jgi:hypothetical protein
MFATPQHVYCPIHLFVFFMHSFWRWTDFTISLLVDEGASSFWFSLPLHDRRISFRIIFNEGTTPIISWDTACFVG